MAVKSADEARAFPSRRSESRLIKALRAFYRNRMAAVGTLLLIAWLLIALFAPLLAPYEPSEQDLYLRLKPMFWTSEDGRTFLLGSDHLGRDILSRLIYGARVSLLVGAAAAVFSAAIGMLLGGLAGYLGGRTDEVIMGLADLQMAFPSILLALVAVAILGQGLRNVIIVFAITGWVQYARTLRADILSIKEREYITATKVVGGSGARTLFRHILPNALAPLIVIASFQMASMITQEAALSFLGVGVPITIPTWGNMLAAGREYLHNAWWISTLPGLALMSVVLGINFLGDALRDAIDPLMRN
jgi:peptide/nickel transport system permease protein